jgi:rod shape-determining protein MreC
MLRDRFARRRIVIFVILVAASVGLMAVNDTAPARELRNGIRFAIAPVQDTLGEGTRSLTSVVGAINEVDSLRRKNEELAATVDRLEDQLAAMESMREENRKLARLLATKEQLSGINTVAASVISRQFTQFERLLTIDKGSESTVREGAPVLSDGGALLGRVSAVGEGWADITLISDPDFLVAGLINRTGATGDVIGRLDAPLAMTQIRRDDNLSVNDPVVTLGASVGQGFRSPYQKGIPIGRVVDIIEEPEQIVKTALVAPEADLVNPEHVLVQTNFRAARQAQAEDDGG